MTNKLFNNRKLIIGMVHVKALPGTPRHNRSMSEIVRAAVDEARLLEDAGFDAVLLENMHDVPYLKGSVGPEITASMTAVAVAVRAAVKCPIGIQILAGANREALAAAHASGAQFIRVEGFVFAHVADEGLIESCAGELLRYRRAIGAEKIQIWADIKKKHSSHAITSDVSLGETAHAAEFFGADALIITGSATGQPTNPAHLEEAARGSALPLIVGSGVAPDNLAELWPCASGFIVGSWLKRGGRWDQPLDQKRLRAFMKAARKLSR